MKVRKESFFLKGKNRERYSSDTVGSTLSRRPDLLFRKTGIYPHVKKYTKKAFDLTRHQGGSNV